MSNRRAKVARFLRQLGNWVVYNVWTDCQHDWRPDGFADWKCPDCGAER